MLDDVKKVFADTLNALDRNLRKGKYREVAELFVPNGLWRDLLSFTWNIRTSEGREEIERMTSQCFPQVNASEWRIEHLELLREVDDVIEGFIGFSTDRGPGCGYLRIKDGKIWTLLTALMDLEGHNRTRKIGVPRGEEHSSGLTWHEQRDLSKKSIGTDTQPYVVIIGGGQNGLSLAAWLRQLGVPALILEKNSRIGDNWRNRYKSLCLHNPIWENEFPFVDYPSNWPIFFPKDRFGDWLENYADLVDLDIWTDSEVIKSEFDERRKIWTVVVRRPEGDCVIHPEHLVFATGGQGYPRVPVIDGQDRFAGIQCHSSEFVDMTDYKDKSVLVIGSGTSAHDIAEYLGKNGAKAVTMLQRSSTYVVKSSSFNEHILGPVYSEGARERGLTIDLADIIVASVPYRLLYDFQRPGVERIKKQDKEFYKALSESGFLLDYGPAGSGLFGKASTLLFNYYIDVGASDMIIDGRIKVVSGTEVELVNEKSVTFRNGNTIECDAIVYATGFETMNSEVARIISPNVAEKIGQVEGFGSGTRHDPGPWVGELRNLFCPTRQTNLWFAVGLIARARFYSKYLAYQLTALYEKREYQIY